MVSNLHFKCKKILFMELRNKPEFSWRGPQKLDVKITKSCVIRHTVEESQKEK